LGPCPQPHVGEDDKDIRITDKSSSAATRINLVCDSTARARRRARIRSWLPGLRAAVLNEFLAVV
jgi:hypothetical protein